MNKERVWQERHRWWPLIICVAFLLVQSVERHVFPVCERVSECLPDIVLKRGDVFL